VVGTEVKSLLGVIGVTLALAAPTLGQEPGVNVDPESPAAKEYGIPLEQARRSAGTPADGRGDIAAFGAGISRGGGQSGPPGAVAVSGAPSMSDATRTGTEANIRTASGPPGNNDRRSPVQPSSGAPVLPTSGGASAAMIMGLIALGVIGGGTALGVGLHRLRAR